MGVAIFMSDISGDKYREKRDVPMCQFADVRMKTVCEMMMFWSETFVHRISVRFRLSLMHGKALNPG